MLGKIEYKLKGIIFPIVLRALKRTSRNLIQVKKPTIVGVTGSVGKSSFIHLLDSVVRDEMRTKTTFKGNSETGLPLEILGIRDYLKNYSLINWIIILAIIPFAYLIGKFKFSYELLIAEMAIDSPKAPKNMAYLLEIIKPDIGVFLEVSAVHSQQFAEELDLGIESEAVIRAIAQEKGRIVTELNKKSTAIINIDSPYIAELTPNIEAKMITFGSSKNADYRLIDYRVTPESTEYVFVFKEKKYTIRLKGYLLSKEYGYTILAVVATAIELGLNIVDVVTKIENRFEIPPGRMSLVPGKNGSIILDSSYNSSPVALRSVLNTLKNFQTKGNKILILGDMRELGPLTEAEHKNLADLVTEVADQVILVGPLTTQYLLPELKKRKVPVSSSLISKGVGDRLLTSGDLKRNDIVLVKGSQNTIFLEQTVLELMENQDQAYKLLCRQSPYWEKLRTDFFKTGGKV